MTVVADADNVVSAPKAKPDGVYRHPLLVRLCHWLNAFIFIVLLMSGLQIFNAHPRLYLGMTGYYDTPAIIEITGETTPQGERTWFRIGDVKIPTTGFLAMEKTHGPAGRAAFPSYMRLPSQDSLQLGRGWHFLFAWLLVFNGAVYVIYALASRRVSRVLAPTKAQLQPRAMLRDVWMHLRLKHAKGEAALHYNLLQKLAYLIVIFVLFPLMVLTGMTMSNSAVAMFHWLPDVFGGRQTARTIHFITAFSLVAFVIVHLVQVFVAGFFREMRSILTGYYTPPPEQKR